MAALVVYRMLDLLCCSWRRGFQQLTVIPSHSKHTEYNGARVEAYLHLAILLVFWLWVSQPKTTKENISASWTLDLAGEGEGKDRPAQVV